MTKTRAARLWIAHAKARLLSLRACPDLDREVSMRIGWVLDDLDAALDPPKDYGRGRRSALDCSGGLACDCRGVGFGSINQRAVAGCEVCGGSGLISVQQIAAWAAEPEPKGGAR